MRLRIVPLRFDPLARLLAAEFDDVQTWLLTCRLACFAQDRLFFVLDALALVRLGRTEAADLRRRAAERLLVDTRLRISMFLSVFAVMPSGSLKSIGCE